MSLSGSRIGTETGLALRKTGAGAKYRTPHGAQRGNFYQTGPGKRRHGTLYYIHILYNHPKTKRVPRKSTLEGELSPDGTRTE